MRCDFCFRDKTPLVPVIPGCPVEVCKACSYSIEHVLGFIRHSGGEVVYQPIDAVGTITESETKISPQTPLKDDTRSKK